MEKKDILVVAIPIDEANEKGYNLNGISNNRKIAIAARIMDEYQKGFIMSLEEFEDEYNGDCGAVMEENLQGKMLFFIV